MAAETRYAKSGEVHIAYQVTGSGPFDLMGLLPRPKDALGTAEQG